MTQPRLLPMLGHTFGKRSAVTCALKCDNACAGEVCNTSKNSYFRDVVSAEVSRRAALGAGAVAAFTAAVTLDTTDASAAAGPKPLGGKAVIGDGQLKFAPIAPVTSTVDAMTVPEGYSWHPIIRWGDPLFADSPAFDPKKQSAAAQAKQFGYNNDYTEIIMDSAVPGQRRALMFVNHEYTNPSIMFPETLPEAERRAITRAVADTLAAEP